jgi:hypothetical protein
MEPDSSRQQQYLKIRGADVEHLVRQLRHARSHVPRDLREQGQELKRGEP